MARELTWCSMRTAWLSHCVQDPGFHTRLSERNCISFGYCGMVRVFRPPWYSATFQRGFCRSNLPSRIWWVIFQWLRWPWRKFQGKFFTLTKNYTNKGRLIIYPQRNWRCHSSFTYLHRLCNAYSRPCRRKAVYTTPDIFLEVHMCQSQNRWLVDRPPFNRKKMMTSYVFTVISLVVILVLAVTCVFL